MTTLAHLPAVLTVEEVAAELRLSRGAAYAGVRAGEIPAIRIGRSLRVPRHALEQMLGVTDDDAPGGQAEREVTTSNAAAGRDDAITRD